MPTMLMTLGRILRQILIQTLTQMLMQTQIPTAIHSQMLARGNGLICPQEKTVEMDVCS